MSPCMASHFPPPEKAGGGALATASRMASNSAGYLRRQRLKEVHRRNSGRWVIVSMTLEEVHQPWLRRGRPRRHYEPSCCPAPRSDSESIAKLATNAAILCASLRRR